MDITAIEATSVLTKYERDDSKGEELCSICLIEFNEADQVRKLECGHIYHSDCIVTWLKDYQKWCPYCRHPLQPKAKKSMPS
jgi:hypothetical protein